MSTHKTSLSLKSPLSDEQPSQNKSQHYKYRDWRDIYQNQQQSLHSLCSSGLINQDEFSDIVNIQASTINTYAFVRAKRLTKQSNDFEFKHKFLPNQNSARLIGMSVNDTEKTSTSNRELVQLNLRIKRDDLTPAVECSNSPSKVKQKLKGNKRPVRPMSGSHYERLKRASRDNVLKRPNKFSTVKASLQV